MVVDFNYLDFKKYYYYSLSRFFNICYFYYLFKCLNYYTWLFKFLIVYYKVYFYLYNIYIDFFSYFNYYLDIYKFLLILVFYYLVFQYDNYIQANLVFNF